jgi:hypothetical protein
VIDNVRDGFQADGGAWGQRLFFNHNGDRASFTGTRISDFKLQNPGGTSASPSLNQQAGLNMVLLVQIPLKHKAPERKMQCYEGAGAPQPCCPPATTTRSSDVENAVIGHGEVEGPFTEIDGLAIERDPRFPIRVTVQFYKATSNGVVSEKDMAGIASQINQVYADGDYVGSLVTGKPQGRPTAYDGDKKQPKDWWRNFWDHYDLKLKK